MIIKKKYTVKSVNQERLENVESEIVLPKNEKISDNHQNEKKQTETKKETVSKNNNPGAVKNEEPENNEKKIPEENTEEKTKEKAENKEDIPEEKPVKKPRAKKQPDLDLSLDNIKFEQRNERREGTRRRGYRRTQDRNIVSRAQQDALNIKESAKQDGYNEGVANAQKDLDEIRNKLAEFFKYKDEIFDKVSGCILDIAVETAKKILNKEIETDKEYIIPLIKSAVEEVNVTENKIILKVMPKDVEIVKGKVPAIFKENGIEAAVSVAADKNIKQGGVVIVTSDGIIDASVETQIAVMENALCGKKGDK